MKRSQSIKGSKMGRETNTTLNLFFIILVVAITISCMPSEGQFPIRKTHDLDLNLGSPDVEVDKLLLDLTVQKEKIDDKVIYSDLFFDVHSYTNVTKLVDQCPYNITAITILHLDSDDTSGYPIVLFGGLGAPEALFLFVSKKSERIHYWVQVWGRPYELSNQNYNLIQGIPDPGDELLMFTNINQTGRSGDLFTANVIYESPENKSVTITSVQAWDISTGCKLGGYPYVSKGGVGNDNVEIQVTSAYRGIQYHFLVIGRVQVP